MKRETTNKIRFIIEDVMPPILRDSGAFRWLAKRAWGDHIDRLAEFRSRAPFLSEKEYEDLYREHPLVHDGSENSQACIDHILKDIEGQSVCDIGCGSGYLLREIKSATPVLARYAGVDLVIDKTGSEAGIEFIESKIETLPFDTNEFDTVVCTHVLEHILDIAGAIHELRRITAKRLIIVVPREREYRYTFNPHFHFFPYAHSFLRYMTPVPKAHRVIDIGRDIYYVEDMQDAREDNKTQAA